LPVSLKYLNWFFYANSLFLKPTPI
jgi:hypothetical protein